jgi:hypothetical protein
MSRRIDTGPAPEIGADGKVKLFLGEYAEPYLGRLIGYIPSEMVALYLFSTGMAASGTRSSHSKLLAYWVIFALVWVLTPLYMMFATKTKSKPPLRPQVILASLAFPVWVYATGGPFALCNWYRGWVASVVLAFVTVIFGMYRPDPGS